MRVPPRARQGLIGPWMLQALKFTKYGSADPTQKKTTYYNQWALGYIIRKTKLGFSRALGLCRSRSSSPNPTTQARATGTLEAVKPPDCGFGFPARDTGVGGREEERDCGGKAGARLWIRKVTETHPKADKLWTTWVNQTMSAQHLWSSLISEQPSRHVNNDCLGQQ